MTTDQAALLSPMWQRIARGEVDLSQYSDDEILSAEIRMADGRLLPAPKVIPDSFILEQQRRGLRVAQRKVRDGAMAALDYYADLVEDDQANDRDRLKAGEWLLNRFLGAQPQHVHVTTDGGDPRELLVERLLSARGSLDAAPVIAEDADVVDADVVDDLEDLI